MSRLALALLLCGCGPSQFLVHVDTDAPVPPRPGAAADPMRPAWLFDQLRVEVLDGSEAPPRRDFGVDEGMFLDGRVSFGVAPPFGRSDIKLRLRLYRGDHATDGEPDPGATLQTDVDLTPLQSSSHSTDIVVRLLTDNVGQPQEEPPTFGVVGGSRVGTWPLAQVVPCNGAPGPDEACIPGGAFWMGDPQLRDTDPDIDAHHERLVVVSPFFLDTHEVTVAEERMHANLLAEWDPSGDADVYDAWCTYTGGPSAADPEDTHKSLAANCVPYDDALLYCRRLGKQLPTEAQYELAASGRGEERRFAWGSDEPTCADAVWGWGGLGQTEGYDAECRTNSLPGGVRAPGSGARDRIRYGDAEIVDLAGNLAEWVLDLWSRQDEAYWSAPGVLVDPLADLVSPTGGKNTHSLRGGGFHDPPLLVRAASRFFARTDMHFVYYKVGFRCARSGR